MTSYNLASDLSGERTAIGILHSIGVTLTQRLSFLMLCPWPEQARSQPACAAIGSHVVYRNVQCPPTAHSKLRRSFRVSLHLCIAYERQRQFVSGGKRAEIRKRTSQASAPFSKVYAAADRQGRLHCGLQRWSRAEVPLVQDIPGVTASGWT